MKEKLSRAFDEQLRRDPENKWLLSQQNLIQLARISTINSFCLDLVKSNLHEFDFQGGLDILDDSVQNLICRKLSRRLMKSFVKKIMKATNC